MHASDLDSQSNTESAEILPVVISFGWVVLIRRGVARICGRRFGSAVSADIKSTPCQNILRLRMSISTTAVYTYCCQQWHRLSFGMASFPTSRYTATNRDRYRPGLCGQATSVVLACAHRSSEERYMNFFYTAYCYDYVMMRWWSSSNLLWLQMPYASPAAWGFRDIIRQTATWNVHTSACLSHTVC